MLEVEIKNLPEIRVAYFRHIGPYELLSPVFDKLASWAGPRGLLSRPDTRVIAVYHDNPDITEKDKLRTSVCVTVPDEFKPEPESGVELMTIPGGKFAVASGELAIGEFEAAWNWFLGDWMPGSGWQPDDRICYEVYLNNHEDHPEKKFIIEIREPVRPL